MFVRMGGVRIISGLLFNAFEMNIIVVIILLVAVVFCVTIAPLLVCNKSSRLYRVLWWIYMVASLLVFSPALWEMMTMVPAGNPTPGPTGPYGNASAGRWLHGLGFLASIPMMLYLITIGRPSKRVPREYESQSGETRRRYR